MKAILIGVGKISGIYLENLSQPGSGVEIAGLYDSDGARARDAAERFGIGKVYRTCEEALADCDAELVINLTPPAAHYAVCRQALLAGKHVYTEKPLAQTFSQARGLVDTAREKGLVLAGAPDTFLGSGLQTCLEWIAAGRLGRIVGARASFVCPGHELWHPNPDFYYQEGAGPVMDMGPYYLTALIQMMGPVRSVSAFAQQTFERRRIPRGDRRGQSIRVEVPTHVNALLRFDGGVSASLLCSFDVWHDTQAQLELFGTKGTLRCPDPNWFAGEALWYDAPSSRWLELPPVFSCGKNARGIGVTEMVRAMERGESPRAGADLLLHVQEAMDAILRSAREKRVVELSTSIRPADLLPEDFFA